MRLYYRISDKGYEKTKLPGATKRQCLNSCWAAFRYGDAEAYDVQFVILADRCSPETVELLHRYKDDVEVEETDLGNSGSMMHAYRRAMAELSPGEIVYFCEDDYVHKPNCPRLLDEASKIGEYFTLYDHPDKYSAHYNYGETSAVTKTKSSHWRYTVSTCMTFGTTKEHLEEDHDLFAHHCQGEHPHDHFIFQTITKHLGKNLAVSIPGAACHTDLTYSGQMGEVLIDEWAIDQMYDAIKFRTCRYRAEPYTRMFEQIEEMKSPWNRLTGMAALAEYVDSRPQTT
jgi:hypothetical protein